MALRIGGARAPMPMEEEMPMEEVPMEEMPMEEEMPEAEIMEEDMAGAGTLDPMLVSYRGPEMGPFMCGNCQHFMAPSGCQHVAGEIDEGGLCNLFSALQPEETMEEPMEEEMVPAEEEMPMEEPEMEEGY